MLVRLECVDVPHKYFRMLSTTARALNARLDFNPSHMVLDSDSSVRRVQVVNPPH